MLQGVVTLFTMKIEYIIVTLAAKEALWLYGLVGGLGLAHENVVVQCDSQSEILFSQEPSSSTEDQAYKCLVSFHPGDYRG